MTRAILLALLFVALCGTSAWAHQGHGEHRMWQVCEAAELGSICSFENAAGDTYRGTCRSISGHLACVRNRPIERKRAAKSAAMPWTSAAGVAGFGLVVALRLRRRAAVRRDALVSPSSEQY